MRLVVIGGGAGGMSAAAAARRVSQDIEIIVLEQTQRVSVGLCGLPYFIGGQIDDPAKLIVHTPDYFRTQRRIDVKVGHRVDSLQPGQRLLTGLDLTNSEPFSLRYDRLVVATGARSRRLGVAGEDLPHVFHLRSLDEAVRLRTALEGGSHRRAVVVGGGFVGLELAEALRHWQVDVSLLEAGDRILPSFEGWASERAVAELEANGVRVSLNQQVAGIDSQAVYVAGGAAHPADLVIIAAGSLPERGLLERAGADIGRSGAAKTSRQMQTTLAAVWAAGDCAESRLAPSGRAAYLPLGTVANLHGRVAGTAAAGVRMEGPALAGTHLLQIFGLALARAGLTEEAARRAGYIPVAAGAVGPVRIPALPAHGSFEVRLVADARSGKLLGAEVVGSPEAARRIDVAAALLARGATVEDAAGIDLGYTPPLGVARDPLVQAAQRLADRSDEAVRRWGSWRG